MGSLNPRFQDRDLSWLAFNGRVLQEAADQRVPLYERLKFLAIFSSNLDEFYRVRVSSLRALAAVRASGKSTPVEDPAGVLRRILRVVHRQQTECGFIFQQQIIPQLRAAGVFLVADGMLTEDDTSQVLPFFRREVAPLLEPVFIAGGKEPPFLKNRSIYLVVLLQRQGASAVSSPAAGQEEVTLGLVEIPSPPLRRFVLLSCGQQSHRVLFLDDVIRHHLAEVFPRHDVLSAHAIKLTRDAELQIDDEFSGDLVAKIRAALAKRHRGMPSRFLYDPQLPRHMLRVLQNTFSLRPEDLIRGGRYHNFHDLFDFPNPSAPEHTDHPMPPLDHPQLAAASPMVEVIRTTDCLLSYPYQSYEPVLRFLREAAQDTAVEAIDITLYRTARESRVIEHLMTAARNGKVVTVFLEVKARFDEESNLRWADELERAGVRILYSFPGLKVHAKLCLVTRREDGRPNRYAYLGTGNFNEKTATVYTDQGLFTADPRITAEVSQVFAILGRRAGRGTFQHLLVSPFTMRRRFYEFIDNEIRNARRGRRAFILAKMNALQDRKMIERLYRASEAGVDIDLLVRGICCLIPGVPGMSSRIRVTSVVDRFLEHARVFVFHNGGDELVYLASADWMKRNLSRRIEVAFPVYDAQLQQTLRALLDLQRRDTVKARVIDRKLGNAYVRGNEPVHSQEAIYAFFAQETSRFAH